MNKVISILIVLLLTTQCTIALSQCKCTPKQGAFPGSNANPIDTLNISTENEFVQTSDIGKLISFGSTTILQNLFTPGAGSSQYLKHTCPSGFVPLIKEELDILIQRPDFLTLVSDSHLKLSPTTVVFSSTKVNPGVIAGGDNKSYEYYSIKYDQKKKIYFIGVANSYHTSEENRKTICKRDLSIYPISLIGYEGYDLEEGKTYEFKIDNSNVKSYYIEDSNGNVYTTQTFSYTHKGDNNLGCATINFRLQIFGEVIAADCISIWTKPQFGFNADSSISIDQIKQVTLDNIKANYTTSMFFSQGSAPVAPIINDSGSVYLYYSNKDDGSLNVVKLSKEGVQIGDIIKTKEIGQPFDIVSTPYGFVTMNRDLNQKAWVSAYNKDGTLRWQRILANNGRTPLENNDQIKFHSSDQCQLPFGMNLMFYPNSGKLVYARGRIQVIWTHFNHFGLYTDGKRNDHTADSFFSLDADTGYNQKIYWSWGSSHSLHQSIHFDGKYMYVANLGDCFPMSIKFNVCNIETHECIGSDKVLPGQIPGNGGGMSAGRQSNFIDIIGNRNEKFFFYQRKASKGSHDGASAENALNEVAMIRLDKDLNYISTKVIIDGAQAARVNTIRAVKYGKNILFAYSMIPASEVAENYNRQSVNQKVDESYLMLLNGEDGSTIYGPQKYETYQMNSVDEWRVLEDGRIVYTFVDNKNNINFFYTPALTIPTYPNPIKSSDNIYGYSSFLNNKIPIKRNNFNDVCIKPGDSNYSIVDFPNDQNNNNNNGSNNNNNNNSNNGNNNNNNNGTNNNNNGTNNNNNGTNNNGTNNNGTNNNNGSNNANNNNGSNNNNGASNNNNNNNGNGSNNNKNSSNAQNQIETSLEKTNSNKLFYIIMSMILYILM